MKYTYILLLLVVIALSGCEKEPKYEDVDESLEGRSFSQRANKPTIVKPEDRYDLTITKGSKMALEVWGASGWYIWEVEPGDIGFIKPGSSGKDTEWVFTATKVGKCEIRVKDHFDRSKEDSIEVEVWDGGSIPAEYTPNPLQL